MRYNIDTFTGGDLAIAESAVIGAEKRVKASYDEPLAVGSISMTNPTSGTFTEDPAYAVPAAGNDLVVVAKNGIKSSGPLALTLAVTFADDTAGAAVATFEGPSGGWSPDESNNFPQFLAVDLIGTGGNSLKKIKSIESVTSITNGANGNQFEVWALPENFFEVTCATDVTPSLPVTKSMPIRCRFNPSRWTKKIPGDAGSLEITTKLRSGGDGLMRLNGHRVTMLVEIVKDDRIVTDRYIFTGYRPTSQPKLPDGENEAEVSGTGNYENVFIFV